MKRSELVIGKQYLVSTNRDWDLSRSNSADGTSGYRAYTLEDTQGYTHLRSFYRDQKIVLPSGIVTDSYRLDKGSKGELMSWTNWEGKPRLELVQLGHIRGEFEPTNAVLVAANVEAYKRDQIARTARLDAEQDANDALQAFNDRFGTTATIQYKFRSPRIQLTIADAKAMLS
jgi:hypothetical protein